MMYWVRKFFTDPEAHFRAFAEVFTVTAFTFALYFGSFVKNKAKTIEGFEGALLDRGEIFLLIYALYGTLFYLAFIHVGKPANGPKKIFGLAVSLAIIPIVLMSGFDPTFKSIVNKQINDAGYFAYVGFLLTYYMLLFYQELSPPDPGGVLNAGAQNMAREASRP